MCNYNLIYVSEIKVKNAGKGKKVKFRKNHPVQKYENYTLK